jgi:hypothetical protein
LYKSLQLVLRAEPKTAIFHKFQIFKDSYIMKTIINGKTYNAETAFNVCALECNHYQHDFKYHKTSLYQTSKGTFFLAGKGGASSIWAEKQGNSRYNGEGIQVISETDARGHMEDAECGADLYEACGLELEEG